MVIDSGNVGKNRLNALTQESTLASNKSQATANKHAAASAPTAGTQDSVSLSGAAKAMQRLENKIQQSPAVNDEKVAEIKQAITSGTYKPDPSAIADKLLADF